MRPRLFFQIIGLIPNWFKFDGINSNTTHGIKQNMLTLTQRKFIKMMNQFTTETDELSLQY